MKTQEIYLNHAGTSWPKPGVVSDAVRDALAVSPADWPHRFDEAHQAIAAFFGVSRREQILLTPGCTSALAVGIGDVQIASGRRVLTSRWEHHALHRPLLKLASAGARLEQIPTGTAECVGNRVRPLDLDWLDRELASGDVALVATTAACNVTGERMPYEDVIEMTHRHDSMVLIDAAQIVGWEDLDLPNLGADLVAFGGHKGLQAPWGIGGLFSSDRARMECVSASCDVVNVDASDAKRTARPGYCDVGSVDQVALAGLHAAVAMLGQRHGPKRLATARRQIRRIQDSLESVPGLRIHGPSDPVRRMPTLAFSIPDSSSGDLAIRLNELGLTVGSGFQCSPLTHQTLGTQADGVVRLSVGVGQADEEIDAAITLLRSSLDR